MPININEIRVIATVNSGKPASTGNSTANANTEDKAKWIQEAVDAVLRVLEEKKER